MPQLLLAQYDRVGRIADPVYNPLPVRVAPINTVSNIFTIVFSLSLLITFAISLLALLMGLFSVRPDRSRLILLGTLGLIYSVAGPGVMYLIRLVFGISLF
jgi:hypothetical protein